MSSHIDEFFAWIELFETLPTERIRRLAPAQNRNFDQMVRHLLEVALSYYPEDPQSSASTQGIDNQTTIDGQINPHLSVLPHFDKTRACVQW